MLSEEARVRLLAAPREMTDAVIDSDAFNEVDDQFAIALALRSPDRIRLRALYAAPFHNENSSGPEDGMLKSYEEIRRLLALCGEEKPVFHGSRGYLPDEKTPVASEAASDLVCRAKQYSAGNPLYVVAIGAITNVASALLTDPSIADRIVVVWLGGHSLGWPDIREFNLRQDVAAARAVFFSGAPLVLVPCLGVASAFTTTGPELDRWLTGRGALPDYLAQTVRNAAEKYAPDRVWSRVLWDVTAVAWLLDRDGRYLLSRLIPTPIPEYGLHWGSDPTGPLCRYVYHVHRDALMGELFSRIV